MSLTSITEHHQKWSALPLFTYDWIVTDEDIQAWSDLIYMRGLADEIIDTADDHGLLPMGRTLDHTVEFDVDLYLDPWPVDVSGQLIDSWKAAA